MLREDIAEAERNARSLVGQDVFESLDEARKGAMVELTYQHGPGGTKAFDKTLDAIEKGDWQRASREMLDSNTQRAQLAGHVARAERTGETIEQIGPTRMETLARRMETGHW